MGLSRIVSKSALATRSAQYTEGAPVACRALVTPSLAGPATTNCRLSTLEDDRDSTGRKQPRFSGCVGPSM